MKKKDFSIDDIDHLAKLSFLELKKDERELYFSQIGEVLEFVAKLQKVKMENVSETSQITGLVNVLRKDKLGKSLDQKAFLNQIPDKDGDYVKVPAILEGNDNA